MTFVDLTEAFDTVSRDGLWKIMQSLTGQPGSWQWCDNSMMASLHGSRTMESALNRFCNNGVKQDCVLAPTLSSILFSVMLTDAFYDCDDGFPIRFDGKLFNLSRLQSKSKVRTDVLDELLYADDMAKNALKQRRDRLSQARDNYDRKISMKRLR